MKRQPKQKVQEAAAPTFADMNKKENMDDIRVSSEEEMNEAEDHNSSFISNWTLNRFQNMMKRKRINCQSGR